MESGASTPVAESLETALRGQLASGDAVIGAAAPGLMHLLKNGSNPLLGDDIVASVRGMAGDLARQLIEARVAAAQSPDAPVIEAGAKAALTSEITRNPALLGHLHALALEWQITLRLAARHIADPVMPPLLQRATAAAGEAANAPALALLAAQARFCQAQRRMELPLGELPGDLLHGVLLAMRTLAGSEADTSSARADAAIRARSDESLSRLGLLARYVTGLGEAAREALSLADAGAAIFVTALGIASGQDRDLAVLSTDRSQHARLTLGLIAAGLSGPAVAEQLLLLHSDEPLPGPLGELRSDRAAAILASSSPLDGA